MSREVSLLTKDIGNKREEIRYQQTLIDRLAKERDDAVSKITINTSNKFNNFNFFGTKLVNSLLNKIWCKMP